MSTRTAQLSVGERDGDLPGSAGPGRLGVGAIVLAGSHAWKRGSLDALLPRPLLPVGDRPLIAYPLGWLASGGVSDATICTNGISPLVRTHLERFGDLPALSYVDDETPRGPAGSAVDAMPHCDAATLIVIECSTVPRLDLHRLVSEHQASGAAVTIVVQPRRADQREPLKPTVPAGIYVFERRALADVPAFGYQDIKEMLLRRLHKAGEHIRTHEAEARCHRVIDARTYLNVNHLMIADICKSRSSAYDADLEASAASTSQVNAHAASRIEPGAIMIGPILLGAHSVVLPGAVVVGPTAIGRHTTIHPNAVVSRSVVWDRCEIAERAFIDQSVVVSDIRVRPNARLIETVRLPTQFAT